MPNNIVELKVIDLPTFKPSLCIWYSRFHTNFDIQHFHFARLSRKEVEIHESLITVRTINQDFKIHV
jgi:hypothetical protein